MVRVVPYAPYRSIHKEIHNMTTRNRYQIPPGKRRSLKRTDPDWVMDLDDSLFDLICYYPERGIVGRDINALFASSPQKHVRAALRSLKRRGLIHSLPTNNRRLGTRWFPACDAGTANWKLWGGK